MSCLLDGSVQLSTGAIEMGQGVNTKMQQIVADEFGLPYDKVRVLPTSTRSNANTSPTAASSGADINGAATLEACSKLKKRLTSCFYQLYQAGNNEAQFEIKDTPPPANCELEFKDGTITNIHNREQQISWVDLINSSYQNRISLSEFAHYRIPDIYLDRSKGQGRPFMYYTCGASVCEVSIDRFTGEVCVPRADIIMDLGESLNPGLDKGQIAGAFIQSLGWITMEELFYNDQGVLQTLSPSTYKIPAIMDTPKEFNIDLISNPDNKISLKRSKAVGEPPFVLGTSIWSAIKNALQNSQSSSIILRVPATFEEILKHMN